MNTHYTAQPPSSPFEPTVGNQAAETSRDWAEGASLSRRAFLRNLLFVPASVTLPNVLITSASADDKSVRRESERGLERAAEYLSSSLQRHQIPGMSLAITRGGTILHQTSYGFANLEHATPANVETLYEIGSITKQFTATLVMLLAREKKLSLDQSVRHWVEAAPKEWEPVTIRNLLNHTSGIKNFTETPNFDKREISDVTQEELVELVSSFPMEFRPGQKWQYCNTNYYLLGMIIEKASGLAYEQYLKEKILQPLGMTQTRLDNRSNVTPGRADGYMVEVGSSPRNAPLISLTWAFSAGALLSNVRDLAKWDLALHSGRLLDKAAQEEMWSPTRLIDGTLVQYGYGWELHQVRDHRAVGHVGGIPGYSSSILRFPERDLSIILLSNRDGFMDPNPTMPPHFMSLTVAGMIDSKLAVALQPSGNDSNPDLTKKGVSFLTRLMRGEADPLLCARTYRESSEWELPFYSRLLRSYGHVDRIELTGRSVSTDVTIDRYQVVFDRAAWAIRVGFDRSGLVSELVAEREIPI
jgi:D-alanyl-D-alanine carboxypeptidase